MGNIWIEYDLIEYVIFVVYDIENYMNI